MSFEQLQTSLEIDHHLLNVCLDMLTMDQQIQKLAKNKFKLTQNHLVLEGRVSAKREGHGVIKTASGREISISPRHMRGIWDGDVLQVTLGTRLFYGKEEGVVHKILERAHTRVTGLFSATKDGFSELIPDNPKLQGPILITNQTSVHAKPKDHIVVQITQYPGEHDAAHGEIIENLGPANSPYVQTELAILRHHLPNQWPKAVIKQAKMLRKPSNQDYVGRVDLRELPLVTIDGESARDFDDAVFACRKPRGGWRLWVAIADVSHYVTKDSPLDIEALERGTSVYFPHRVVPMLPEALSNDLCSLKPHVDRLAMVCEMAISAKGKVTKFVFYEAVICSHARLTYTQVSAYLNGTEHELQNQPTISASCPGLCEPLHDLYSLYQALFQTRQERGALEFDTIESEFAFDEEGHINNVVPIHRNDAHRLIEEMMLAANVSAAKLLIQHDAPGVFRNHEPPSKDRLETLVNTLKSFGATPHFGEKPQPKDFLTFLNSVTDRADSHILNTVMLRSMNQARYEPECKGHFGLAYPAYTHFTSPIRRYPDLLVHRTIRYLIRNQKGTHLHREAGAKKLRKQEWIIEKPSALAAVAKQNSDYERRADEATRDVVAWLKCSYMLDQIGAVFDGHVSGVTHFGLFITIDELMIDGLIHISNLAQDYYTYNEQTHQLIGERSGKVFKIGDLIQIRVANVSLDDRKIDFMPVHTQSSNQRKKAKRKGS